MTTTRSPSVLSATLTLTGLAVLVLVVSCSGERSSAQAPASSVGSDIPKVLASIADEQITMTDIRARVADQLDQMESRYRQGKHHLIETTLQEIIRDRVLLAETQKQGKTVDQLIQEEAGGSLEPSEVEIAAWYQANQSRTGGRSLDQLRTQIGSMLRDEKQREARDKLYRRLDQERRVVVHLEPFRVELNNEGSPSMGPENAPVTLAEFSDFQCPFCGRFHPTLRQLEERFGEELRIVYRQFPIPSLHPNAFKAAEASLCAHDQGKFWEIHDLMFREQDRLSVRELKAMAGRLGMDQRKFESCLDSGRYTEQVQDDMREGNRLGVTGTPALFVNGVPIEGGAVAFEVVAQAIEQELKRVRP